ncbi:SURF1 family cytochrome oxidase biogenesis protein [Kribbella monticola]|uniref:SURF1 family cytochrome oxidase biogenesis protein n=1 Tax=Kribbella monticola TaxID=2185285 RepID=UPI001E2B168C|nr:SURF1 family protein [Kribbella monticola]
MPRAPHSASKTLLNPRWIVTAVLVLLLAGVCVELGRWQLHRLDERKSRNEVTRSNLAAPPAPIADIVGPDHVIGQQHDWRTVVVTGRYDAAKQVVIRYRNLSDRPGFEIVTPLELDDGTAVLVDRGFLPRQGSELAPMSIPAAPSGEVTVTGRLRRSEHGGHTSGGVPVDGTARLINGPDFSKALGLPLYDGYVIVDKQQPPSDPAFDTFPGPEIDNGPHFFYALQWFFFALMAIGGLVYFSRRDVQDDKSAEAGSGHLEAEGTEGGSGTVAVGAAGPEDRGLRADRGHPDSGAGLD